MTGSEFLFWSAVVSLLLGFLPLHEIARRLLPDFGLKRKIGLAAVDLGKTAIFMAVVRYWWTTEIPSQLGLMVEWQQVSMEWFLALLFMLGYVLSPFFKTVEGKGLWVFAGLLLLLSKVSGFIFFIFYFLLLREKCSYAKVVLGALLASMIGLFTTASFGFYLLNAGGMVFLFLFSHDRELGELLEQ